MSKPGEHKTVQARILGYNWGIKGVGVTAVPLTRHSRESGNPVTSGTFTNQ